MAKNEIRAHDAIARVHALQVCTENYAAVATGA